MSRLIVKNLPTYVTPVQLRNHFEQKGGPGGTITDVKVTSKANGKSRQFGFVGYKSNAEAQAAKEWFDRTFIHSNRIDVTIIDGAKGAPTPRPNKRPRLDPSSEAGTDRTVSTGTPIGNPRDYDGNNATFEEFVQVMQPRAAKGPMWANGEGKPQAKPTITPPQISNDDDENVDKGEALSDMEWMKRHMSSGADTVQKVFEQEDEEVDEVRVQPQLTHEAAPAEDNARQTILQTSRLFLRNLTFSCTDAEIEELFSPYGEIAQVHIPVDSLTKQSKGLAYVTFRQSNCALAAYEALDKKSFQGRLLHILPAVDRKGKTEVVEGSGKKTVKDDRAEKRKATASKEFNWSMLYMNSDAVASSIASRMNIPKSEILNSESDNAAVKLALAETHIINETKTYLESQGVVLSSFASRGRSDTTILVKNIPYGTTAEQITEMFSHHGSLSRVLVPPAGTMAVVEFDFADEAQKAFRGIAYRRLGNSIIYLEKGPQGMFLPIEAEKTTDGPAMSTAVKPVRIAEQNQANADEDIPSLAAGTTLFVKNLAFSTTSERLTQVFRHLPSFSFARVQTKPDPKKPGKDTPRLSMGYGFVGFKDVEGAKKALKSMQDFVLDGHALHVKFAGRGQDDSEDGAKGSLGSKSQTTTKIIVKNVPFEATKKDVRALFSAHGQLKSVRVPKRFDARSRGFAFLDFVSRHEAENAYNALKHTHLLGRHLVLQWAEEAEDLETLRLKAGVGFGGGKDMPGRKRKMDMGGDKDADVEDMEE